jgi:hypothetical protein
MLRDGENAFNASIAPISQAPEALLVLLAFAVLATAFLAPHQPHEEKEEIKNFQGTIAKAGAEFALEESANGGNYGYLNLGMGLPFEQVSLKSQTLSRQWLLKASGEPEGL